MRDLVARWYEEKQNVDELHLWNAALMDLSTPLCVFTKQP